MSISPFKSDQALIDFASKFVENHIIRFRKDMGICLTPNETNSHAYFPGLMACISFLEFFSGLHAGKLQYLHLDEIKNYVEQFMDGRKITPYKTSILYEGFRHKVVAHLAHPYVVFNTSTSNKIAGEQKRIAWTVSAKADVPAVQLRKETGQRYLKVTLTPWDVPYDHRVTIGLPQFQEEIIESVTKESGYLDSLHSVASTREKFAICMKDYFPM